MGLAKVLRLVARHFIGRVYIILVRRNACCHRSCIDKRFEGRTGLPLGLGGAVVLVLFRKLCTTDHCSNLAIAWIDGNKRRFLKVLPASVFLDSFFNHFFSSFLPFRLKAGFHRQTTHFQDFSWDVLGQLLFNVGGEKWSFCQQATGHRGIQLQRLVAGFGCFAGSNVARDFQAIQNQVPAL